ncbi:hypothetical protein AVEN_175332-1 [Araneus ventricosus]|uniref:Uncharacterized protein n=1 Tax=Araneus ventricosus TaxID=182803 RepID=A0A4Y2GZ50_ARAVE|nr:hypothetical protein AVEN_175332-1 [Araneus ventricosus]
MRRFANDVTKRSSAEITGEVSCDLWAVRDKAAEKIPFIRFQIHYIHDRDHAAALMGPFFATVYRLPTVKTSRNTRSALSQVFKEMNAFISPFSSPWNGFEICN